jgi:hypothetical protein
MAAKSSPPSAAAVAVATSTIAEAAAHAARAAASAARAANVQMRANGHRIKAVEARMGALEIVVAAGNADTAKVLSIVATGKRTFRVFEWLLGASASAAVVLEAVRLTH